VVKDHIPENIIQKYNETKSWEYGYNIDYDMVIISRDGTIGQILNINNLLIALPEMPKKGIRFDGLTRDAQRWIRYKVPNELKYFDKYFSKEKNIESKINEIYKRYEDFIAADFHKIKNGDWLYIDGEPIYISGGYYFFMQHYFLPEDGIYPYFRMPQRDYYIWLEACFADNRCVGSLLLKSRRSSFTVTSSSEILRDAIRYRNSYFPIMADIEKHAKRIFKNYIIKPFLEFPKHLQPMRSGNIIPVGELRFEAIKRRLTTNSKVSAEADGLNTEIAPTPTTTHAYDSTRPRKSFNDEIGKTEIDIVEWWAVHKRCHVEGSKIKGKAICGSTARPANVGGKEYQMLYENSQLSKRTKTGFTPTGLYSIFIPADFAQSGFFDQWGYVVYENPDSPIKNEFGEMINKGSKQFLDEKETACKDLKSLNYEKRQDPRVDTDAFLDEDASNMYATTGMMNLINFLKDYQSTQKYKSTVFRFDLVWKDGKQDTEIEMIPGDKGRFLAYAPNGLLPIPVEFRNKWNTIDGKKSPRNGHLAALGVDPYLANRTKFGSGSMQGMVGMTTNSNELSENHQDTTFLYYNFRGETFENAVEDVIKCCVYFSIPVLPEINKPELAKELKKRGYRKFVLDNPLKKKSELTPTEKELGGMYSTPSNIPTLEHALDTYIKTQFSEEINENNIKSPFSELNEHASEYTRDDRGSKDDVVAWQYAKLATSKEMKKKEPIIVENTNPVSILSLLEFN
jgi:hypothetical protein